MHSAYTRRLEGYLEQLYLMATTFSVLALHERSALGDTLLSLTCSFTERAAGALLMLPKRAGEPLISVALRGTLDEELVSGLDAAALWRQLIEERAAQIVPPARLPEALRAAPGLAAVAITLDDHPVALLMLGASAREEPFLDADLSFLTAAAGIGALSLAAADSVGMQQQLVRDMKQTAARAQREAEEKERLLRELDRKLAIIDRQHQEILALSSPVLSLWSGVLLLPVIGAVDERRGAEILARVLAAVVERRASHVIVDLTGAEGIDRAVADQFLRLLGAVRLLGARSIITGIRPEVAQTLISLGVDLSAIATQRSLEEALKLCIQSARVG